MDDDDGTWKVLYIKNFLRVDGEADRFLQTGMMKEFESKAEEMVVLQTTGSRTNNTTSGPTTTSTAVQVDWEAINAAIRSSVALVAPAVVPRYFTNIAPAPTITDAVTSRHVVEETVGKHDVLFGKENTAKDHEGNIRLKKLIQSYKLEYEKADYTAKTDIADGIIRTVHEYGGCFLKLNRIEGYWEEVDRKAAREKITHSFRYIRNNNKNRPSMKQIIPVALAAPAASVVPRTDATTPASAAATAAEKLTNCTTKTGNITASDVLFGRGTVVASHPGNRTFRKIVQSKLLMYDAAKSKREKKSITLSIVHKMKEQLHLRFMKEDNTTGVWIEVTDNEIVRRKVIDAFGHLRRKKKDQERM